MDFKRGGGRTLIGVKLDGDLERLGAAEDADGRGAGSVGDGRAQGRRVAYYFAGDTEDEVTALQARAGGGGVGHHRFDAQRGLCAEAGDLLTGRVSPVDL